MPIGIAFDEIAMSIFFEIPKQMSFESGEVSTKAVSDVTSLWLAESSPR